MKKHGYLGCFHAASTREHISGVWGIMYGNFVLSFKETVAIFLKFCLSLNVGFVSPMILVCNIKLLSRL